MNIENNFGISNISQKEIKNLAALVLKNISNPENGLGKDLFNAIIAIVPQTTVEAIIVDSIDHPTKVLVMPRNDRNYPKSCHLPGSFIRYSETFSRRLHRLVQTELKVDIRKFKDTNIKYNCLEKKNKRHIIGLYFLVQLIANPTVVHRWVDYIPKNLIRQHKDFLKNYFHWKIGASLWE
ncbi:MAG: hypothetical protein HY005_01300 [Candidatus Staskawiczbacteria bacterium]|nr:hypothetical protein [Candidatus Staskawiczbacteria bacterium]MBI3337243.1 hypothetical protein [Candidatus Staskawiczbacteria bacterium]